MINVGVSLLGQVVKTAAFGAVATKIIDSVVTSKINKKNEKNKWVRETMFQSFTQLSQEVLSYDIVESEAASEKNIKELIAKIVLLTDDRRLVIKLESYINQLNKTKRALIYKDNYCDELIEKFNNEGLNLVVALKNNLKKA